MIYDQFFKSFHSNWTLPPEVVRKADKIFRIPIVKDLFADLMLAAYSLDRYSVRFP